MTVFTAAFFGAAGVVEVCAERFKMPALKAAQSELRQRTNVLMTNSSIPESDDEVREEDNCE